MKGILIPYGLKDEKLCHISKVPSGLACECICPACHCQLVARKGHKKVHHFAHHNSEPCRHALETTLHLLAKEALEQEKRIFLPAVTITSPSNNTKTIYAAQMFHFDKVVSEKRFGKVVPDIVAYKGKSALFIEVFVTHRADVEKRIKLRKAGVSAVEIDLSACLRNMTIDAIRELMLDDGHRRWIYNKKAEAARQKYLVKGVRKRVIQRGRIRHVNDCPLNCRSYRGRSYANVWDDCATCLFLLDYGQKFIVCGAPKTQTMLEASR